MSNPLNITKAAFGGLREVTTAPLWQYDYGQILQIAGLDLPQAFEVHFSNSRKSGETVTQIGTDSQVVIPDMYLTSGADIYAFIFLHDGLTDGETEYVIKIPVRERPEPSDIEPTPEQQDAITEAIAALNAAVAQCGAYVEHYPTVINGYWYVWDEAQQTFVTTDVPATGNGIASAVLNNDYTLTLTFTDGTQYTTPSIRGAQGETGATGATPDFSVGTVITLPAGSSATASITGTAEEPILNLSIPQGQDGAITNLDATLSIEGKAADAKAVGDAIDDLKDAVNYSLNKSIGKNICDQSKNVLGQIQSDGTIKTNGDYALYTTSDFIELEANTDYCFTVFNPDTGNVGTGQRVLSILLEDTKSPIVDGYQNVSTGGILTFNSGTAKYVRVSARGTYKFQLEEGTTNTSYEAYTVTYDLACLLGDNPLAQVNTKINTAIANTGIVETVTGKNLVDPSKLVSGYIQSNGSVSTSGSYANYSTSDYIPLDTNADYVFATFNSSGNVRTDQRVGCLLYDESKTVISGTYQNLSSGGTLTFNSGSTAKYARVGTTTSGSYFQLEKGRTTPSTYEAYAEHDEIALPLGAVPSAQVQAQAESVINNSGIIQYEVGRNLVDPDKLTQGCIRSNGNVSTTGAYADYSTSDFIPLDASTDYVFTCYNSSGNVRTDKKVGYLLLDNDKAPITGGFQDLTTGGTVAFNSGATAKYARVSTYTANSIFQLEKGSVSAGLEEYSGHNVVGYPLGKTPFDQSQTGNILYGKKWAVCGDSFTAGATATTITDAGPYKGYKYTYPYLIGNRNYMEIVKFFNGGQTLAFPAVPGTFVNSLTNPTGANYYQDIPADADYITIYLGINDCNHASGSSQDDEETTGEIPIGEITDNTTATYYGAWNVVLTWLITNRPNAHIGMIVTNGNNGNDNYRLAQIAIAQKYGVPYIDMNGDARTPAMIRTSNPNIAAAVKTALIDKWKVSSSNTHPNDAAHLYESTFIEEFLRSI